MLPPDRLDSIRRLSTIRRALRCTAAAVCLALPAMIATASWGLTPPVPTNSTPPTVSGVPDTGSTLTATTGSWHPTPTGYSYQWQRSVGGTGAWTNIAGATAATYLLGAADVGDEDRVTVTATDGGGSATANSAATSVIIGPPGNTTPPTVTGATIQGSRLTASPGGWNPTATSYSYQWQRSLDGTGNWDDIAGATGSTYILTAADVNSAERVTVTAVNSAGSASATSSATALITQGPPIVVSTPTVTGSAVQGGTLTASPGSWDPTPDSYAYQWQSSAGGTGAWTDISGATGASYTPLSTDENHTLRVRVTGTNAYGSVTATSDPTALVSSSPPVNLQLPIISGTPTRGHALTATAGSWSGNGDNEIFQWQRSSNGSTWTDIDNAVTARYRPVKADEGRYLRVLVLAGNVDGAASAASNSVLVPGSPDATAKGLKRVATVSRAGRRGHPRVRSRLSEMEGDRR